MSRTVLLVGTRKGLFMLESDADRKNWSMRGAYCEGWPIYHAVFDKESGAIFRLMTLPGIWLQNLTTREPSDDQLEVAIYALKESLKLEPETATA